MKRSKDEIAGLILELCEAPASRTRVVYQCNLNFNTVKPYLDKLTTAGLLEEESKDSITAYKTTAKGVEALEHFRAFRGMVGALF